ncbi:MAG: discoidin domain-containing protein [Melioribacteraceae bacterium]|nr:discoidin domain-containing protein [Melioribacteraceae bacterium]
MPVYNRNLFSFVLIIAIVLSGVVFSQTDNFQTVQFEVKNVTASSTSHPSTSPLFTIDGKGAFDGDVISRWSTYPTPAWICYDLGEIKSISKTSFSFYYFNKGRVYTYSIHISDDNNNWKTIVENATSGNKEYTDNSFLSVEGRYIKLEIHSANNSKWATIWETKIFGSEDLTPPKLKNVDVLSASSLMLTFSENLDNNAATNISNYSITGGISITSASLVDGKKIVLNTSLHSSGNYTITANNISDLYGNKILTDNSMPYSYFDDSPIIPEPEKPTEEKLDIVNVYASSTSNTLTSPLATIDGKGAKDGDATSRWSTYPTSAWICYDLGEIKAVSETRISFYYYDKGRTYSYSVYVSEDNNSWTTVIDNAKSSTNEFTENQFTTINGRYIKLEIHEANNSKWATVWETEIIGNNLINTPVIPQTKKVDFTVLQGWNIVSIPVEPKDRNTDLLFQYLNISQAFNYDEDYIEHQTIKSGLGYWVRFKDNAKFEVEGYSNKESIELREGWNMIGSIDNISINNLYTEPANIIQSLFYGFNGNYTIEDSLIIGKGYWVKTTGAGTLYFSDKIQNCILSKTSVSEDEDLKSITITDSKNKSMTLYLSDNNSSLQKIALPPIPPEGAFDIRFTNGLLINSLTDLNSEIKIRDAGFPISVTSDCDDLVLNYFENGIVKKTRLYKGETIRISDNSNELINVEYEVLPSEYSLEQNYPNPFNPTTTISFSIPVNSKVELDVFNILGEKITTLVNDVLSAGKHKIEFNANNLSSGIYIYALKANNFSKVKKLTLIK